MSRVAAAAVLLVSSLAAPLAAQTVYGSRTAFESALTGASTLTFDDAMPADFYDAPGAGNYFALYGPLGPIDFQAAYPDIDSRVVDGSAGTMPEFDYGTGTVYTFRDLVGGGNVATFAAIGAPFTAFGFDFAVVPNTVVYSPSFTVRLLRGGVASTTLTGSYGAAGGLQFFGVVDSTPFDALELTWNTDTPVLDNVTTAGAPVTATPEPMSLALVGSGLLLVGAAHARRRRSA